MDRDGVALALALVASTAQQANAALITYEFSGIGSGKIGATSFTDALLVFTGIGHTENVIGQIFEGYQLYGVPLDSLVVAIAGVGTATLTEPAMVAKFPLIPDADDLPPIPLVILGRIDHPPSLDSFTGIAAAGDNALADYDLRTSIGPVGVLGGVGFPEECGVGFNDPCLSTSLGTLTFTSNIVTESGGTFTATRAVPEPASLALVGAGLAAFARRRSRRS